MRNFWTFLLLAALLQSFLTSVVQAGHHGHHSDIGHILAAGLIVQLLAQKSHHKGHHHHKGHYHHEGRHSDAGHVHSEYSPYGGGEENRAMTPQASLASSSWAQRAPLDIGYSQARYYEPVLESYNVPYYNNHHQYGPQYQQYPTGW